MHIVPRVLKVLLFSAGLATVSFQINAQNLDLHVPEKSVPPLLLAANGDMPTVLRGQPGSVTANPWHEPWVTGNKAHEYMGIGSLVLAGLTVLTAPDSEEGTAAGKPSGTDLHQALATGAAALGIGAVATGFVYHLDDIHLDNGITDPDNLHMLLGLIGTAGYLVALSQAPDEPNYSETSHSTAGIIGGISMIAAIKLEW